MTRQKVKIPRRTNAMMRKAEAVGTWSVLAAIWLVFPAEVLSAIFTERVFFGGQFDPYWEWVSC